MFFQMMERETPWGISFSKVIMEIEKVSNKKLLPAYLINLVTECWMYQVSPYAFCKVTMINIVG